MRFRRKRETFGPQVGVHSGCYGCAKWPEPVREVCLVDGCEQQATSGLCHYYANGGIGFRRWYYMCSEHARQVGSELFVNVGGDGPFDQDVRLRKFV